MVVGKRNRLSRKQILKEPDEFLTVSHHIMRFVLTHQLRIAGVMALVFAVFIISSTVQYFSQQAEDTAFYLMQKSISQYKEVLKKDGPKKAYESVSKDFEAIFKDYSGKQGEKLARLAYAHMAYDADEFDKALTLYKNALENFENNASLKNMIVSAIAHACEAKKDHVSAVKYFEMVASSQSSLMTPDALFNLGYLYEKTGNKDKSTKIFKKLADDYPDSIYANFAKDKIAG